jgi:ectoine hydroxylase-related dioxygenase (phytanoyl-CoA dioxygenase family)
MSLSDQEKHSLDESGYLVLPGFIPAELLVELRRRLLELFDQEGEQAGHEFKYEPGCRRLANLVEKGEVFRTAIALPSLLAYVGHVLGGTLKLSSLNARLVPPGEGAQPLHADMSAIADERGYWVCNTVWMLDDFTPHNGTLRIVPGSQTWRRLPAEVLADPKAPHPDEILITGQAGSVVIVNAHAWHGGTANRTEHPRIALHAFYARRDRPQQQYQKKLLSLEVQRSLPPQLRDLLALDDPVNDQLSGEVTVRSGFLK